MLKKYYLDGPSRADGPELVIVAAELGSRLEDVNVDYLEKVQSYLDNLDHF